MVACKRQTTSAYGCRVGSAIAVAICGWLSAATPAASQSRLPSLFSPAAGSAPTRELWTGVVGASRQWSVYSGGTLAPFGSLNADGLRFRVQGGVGHFAYSGLRYDAATNQAVDTRFRGTATFGDALVGWHSQLGQLTVKAFGGATYQGVTLMPFDDYASGVGQRWAYKVALETWWNASPSVWIAIDASASGLDVARFAKLRIGYRLSDTLSIGVAAQGLQTTVATEWAAGPFFRFDTGRLELTLSGASTVAEHGAERLEVMAQALVRF